MTLPASLAMLPLIVAAAPLLAQPIIPNPLVQPSAAAAAAGGASAPAGAGASAATPPAAAGGRGAPPATSSRSLDASPLSPLPPGAEGGAEPPSIPLAVQERVSGLYVAAIVDRSAVLRSQLAVPQMVFAGGGVGAPSASAGASQQGQGGGGGGSSGGGGVGSLPGTAGPTVYRSSSYVVRDGQVVDFIDRYRVLARVSRDTVVLYLMPEKGAKNVENKVVFRGSIDSVIAAPPVPARGLMESPDGGIDGKARRELADVTARGGGVARSGSTGSSSGTNPGSGTSSR